MNALSTTRPSHAAPKRAGLVTGSAAVAVFAAGIIALSGCAGAAGTAPTAESPSSAPVSTPAPSPSDTADAGGIPAPDAETAAACEEKIPLASIQDAEGNPAWQQI
ncbi:MAG: hypothetical protein DI566_06365 [Microbacterium sp.]|nr:MAG: hypothetical protein DI566_06365 [Microbacterium sp.]